MFSEQDPTTWKAIKVNWKMFVPIYGIIRMFFKPYETNDFMFVQAFLGFHIIFSFPIILLSFVGILNFLGI